MLRESGPSSATTVTPRSPLLLPSARSSTQPHRLSVTVSPAAALATGQTGHCVTSTRPCHRTQCHQNPPLSPDKQVTVSPALALRTEQRTAPQAVGHCVTITRPCHRTNRSLCHHHPPLSPDKQVTVSPAPALVTGQTGHCVTSTRPCHRPPHGATHSPTDCQSPCYQQPLSWDKQVTVSPAPAPVTGQTGHRITSTRPCHRTNWTPYYQHPPLSPDKLVTILPAPAPVIGQTVTVSPAMALVTEQTGHCVSCTKLFWPWTTRR